MPYAYKGLATVTVRLRWPGEQAQSQGAKDMSEPNNPATLDRAQEQIAKIAGAETYSAVNLLNLWARGYVHALFAEGLIDWAEYSRLHDAVDQQRDQRRAELKAAKAG